MCASACVQLLVPASQCMLGLVHFTGDVGDLCVAISDQSRRANIEAHKLAKHSLSLGLWFGQPHDLACILQSVVFD